jgi:hypothetical protein
MLDCLLASEMLMGSVSFIAMAANIINIVNI